MAQAVLVFRIVFDRYLKRFWFFVPFVGDVSCDFGFRDVFKRCLERLWISKEQVVRTNVLVDLGCWVSSFFVEMGSWVGSFFVELWFWFGLRGVLGGATIYIYNGHICMMAYTI